MKVSIQLQVVTGNSHYNLSFTGVYQAENKIIALAKLHLNDNPSSGVTLSTRIACVSANIEGEKKLPVEIYLVNCHDSSKNLNYIPIESEAAEKLIKDLKCLKLLSSLSGTTEYSAECQEVNYEGKTSKQEFLEAIAARESKEVKPVVAPSPVNVPANLKPPLESAQNKSQGVELSEDSRHNLPTLSNTSPLSSTAALERKLEDTRHKSGIEAREPYGSMEDLPMKDQIVRTKSKNSSVSTHTRYGFYTLTATVAAVVIGNIFNHSVLKK